MKQSEGEPNQSKQAGRRGDVSIADIITAAARLGATDPADMAEIGQILRLTTPLITITPRHGSVPTPADRSHTSSSAPSTPTTTPGRPGITGRPVAARLRQEDRDEPIPTWFAAVKALPPASSHSFDVPPEPPLPVVQARSSVATLAATWRPGTRLDMAALVKRSARLQPLTACFQPELRTAPFVQILIDRGEGMEPYTDDLDFLAAQFVDVAGRDRVELRTFVGTPLRGLDPDIFTGETAEWKRPAAKALVLALTDLGVGGPPGSRDRASADDWRAVAAMVTSAQAGLRVLTPFPLRRLPTGLTEIMHIVSWDSLVHLVRLRD